MFLVLEDGQIRKYGLLVGVGSERLMKGEKVITRMQAGDVCAVRFVGLLKVGVEEKESLTVQNVEQMQEWFPMIHRLRECILYGKLLIEGPGMLKEFKRYASRLCV